MVNTAVLAVETEIEEENVGLKALNMIFYFVFLTECILKLLSMGWRDYFKDRFNMFDAFIVLVSSINNFSFSLEKSSSGASLTALRAFRLLRIFKIVKALVRFQQLLKTIFNTFSDASNFTVLLFLFIFVYALLGMDLFAFKCKFNSNYEIDLVDGKIPYSTFNDFW